MAKSSLPAERIAPEVWHIRSGANTAIIIDGKNAVVVNPSVRGLSGMFARLGVQSVSMILFTHHRRELADGLSELMSFRPRILVPSAEEALFRDPSSYWNDPASRWKLLCTRMPYHATHIHPIAVSGTLDPGRTMDWGAWRFSILSTPGYTDGAVSIIASKNDVRIAFTGDLIFSPGRLYDLYSLQRGASEGGHTVGDYHGYLGSRSVLLKSLYAVLAEKPTMLIPAHGEIMRTPKTAIQLLSKNIKKLYSNYAKVSALRWYFPKYFSDHRTGAMPRSRTMRFPPQAVRLHAMTWALVSARKRAILIDPFSAASITAAKKAVDDGRINGYDGIWISHYHHDHVEAAEDPRREFNCPVMTDAATADVIARPMHYLLTCLSPRSVTVDRACAHGESWAWEDHTLTALHFPGQTYYHAGLFAVSGRSRFLFTGDSFTPNGIDDYCMWNRNISGGYEACLDLIEQLSPTHLFNQHVSVAFKFSPNAIRSMRKNLAVRKGLLRAVSAFDNGDMSTDEYWAHTYPYEQSINAGESGGVAVRIMNHTGSSKDATVHLACPEGWTADAPVSVSIPPKSEASVRSLIHVPSNARGRNIIPVRIVFGGIDLGSFRECIINAGNIPHG